jgi:hypothetical protein
LGIVTTLRVAPGFRRKSCAISAATANAEFRTGGPQGDAAGVIGYLCFWHDELATEVGGPG